MDGRQLGKDSLQDGKEERAVCAQQIAATKISLSCIKKVTIWIRWHASIEDPQHSDREVQLCLVLALQGLTRGVPAACASLAGKKALV